MEYSKLKHEEHVLQIPDTYIGSVENNTESIWVLNNDKMKKENITYIPGLYKLYDEVAVNALDQYIRLKHKYTTDNKINKVTSIEIVAEKNTGKISVKNDGEGISVKIHDKEKIYIPELIFGNLLTSSNYNKKELKHVGGKNGYGAKLANIFSTCFEIETVDYTTHKKFYQKFHDNMTKKDAPIITNTKIKPYTKITYHPDYNRFKIDGITDDMMKIMEKRAYDISAYTDNSVSVYFNGTLIKQNTFEKYIDLFIGSKQDTPRAYEKINDRWEVVAALNPNLSFEQVSFVNGINTINGGKHVDYIVNQITKKLAETIKKKRKIDVKPIYIKENIIIFIKCTIDNPSFNSQTKDCLTTPISKFGSKCELSQKFIDILSKCGILERAIELNSIKENKDLKKSDGKKMNRIRGIPKLDDANWAGTKKSNQCTLILTEGDSAKTLAISGLSVIGRDKYGVFPLRGKLLNVQDEKNMKKLLENAEINNIKKIMGLQAGKKYKNIDELRYGKILILTDQDEDGSHIKGLLFNLFKTLWPSLFNYPGFMLSMLTPVIKTRKGTIVKQFYSTKDYNIWASKNNDAKGWMVKYYKGLGTSTAKEAKEYFKDLKIVEYTTDTDEDRDAINLAFNKEKFSADKRKEWLQQYDNKNTLDYSKKKVSIKEYVYEDLIHFSNSDNVRSLPHICDGLKPSQRKILYCSFKRNLTKEIKVAQLAGYVSEHGAYHHGEMSLHGTIINMAQNFIGSNNINLFEPIGQFGTRIHGGKDAAQPRYIHTKLCDITQKIYNKLDEPLYTYNMDDGVQVEPKFYVPIIPMLLVNGSQGIGTGWSTEFPCHNPYDIINNIKRYLMGEELKTLVPWYKNFKGKIINIKENVYQTRGIYEVDDYNDKVIIKELPIGLWTQKYQEDLENITIDKQNKSKNQYLKYYNSYCTDTEVHYDIIFPKEEIYDYLQPEGTSGITKLEKILKLTSSISTTNMVYYDENNKIKKAKYINDIFIEYCDIRLNLYEKRRLYLIDRINEEIDALEIKIRFITDFIDEKLIIIKKKKTDIIEQLEKLNYPKSNQDDYDYLLKMPIYNLTQDKIDEFNDKLDKKKLELDYLKTTNKKEMWLNELNDLEIDLKKLFSVKNETVKKKKKLVKKSK